MGPVEGTGNQLLSTYPMSQKQGNSDAAIWQWMCLIGR